MTESARSGRHAPPHGSMTEEAAKLAEVAHLWLVSRSGTSDRDDVWAEATATPSPDPPECSGCPICRVRRTVADVNPEVYGHLADAVGSLAAALRALSKDAERA